MTRLLAFVTGLGALALLAAVAPTREVAQEEALHGKQVVVIFRDAYAPHPGFNCAYAIEGKVTHTSAQGMQIKASKLGSTQYLRMTDGSERNNLKSEDYSAAVFIPWPAVKYVKTVE